REQTGRAAGMAAAVVEEHIADRIQPVEHAVNGLSQRLEENDRNTLELVLALGQLCLHTAERLSGPSIELAKSAAEVVQPEPEAPAEAAPPAPDMAAAAAVAATVEPAPIVPQEAESAAPTEPSKTLWRIPLVSS